jgi:flagellar hook-basal body complex protein FliE
MSEINSLSLINQMRIMAEQARGQAQEVVNTNQSFSNVMQKAIDSVNDYQQQSSELKNRYELGDPQVSLGEVMVASQKSSIAFEATLRVRNKVVQAYQDIMNMPL